MLKSPGAFGKGACQRMPHEMCPAGSSLPQPHACSNGGSPGMCGAQPWPGRGGIPSDAWRCGCDRATWLQCFWQPSSTPQARSCARLLVPRFVPGQLSQALPGAPQIPSH